MVESIKGKKLNKGEWAEFYVMMKLLGEGKLYTANKLLQKNYQSYLDVLKIIRQECESQVLEYIIDEANAVVIVKPQDSEAILATMPVADFNEYAKMLFDGIKDVKGSSVPAPDPVCDFAKVIYVSKPKAPAVKALKKQFGGKNDIFIEVRDGQTAIVSIMGFSIKSKFGQNPTLFNAGSSSQFLYKLTGCNDTMMEEFNAITENGELYNVDGRSNRVAALLFGPDSVVVVAGVNKIVCDIDEAIRRHKTVAAPANSARLHCNTPCVRTGKCVSLMRQTEEDMCAGCASEDRICASYVISARQREVGRIKVILVCEELGF